MMPRLTLRARITLLTSLILIMTVCLLTIASISGANHYFSGATMNKVVIGEVPADLSMNDGEQLNNLGVTVQVMDSQKKFTVQSLVFMGIIMVIGIGLIYMIVGRALKPLTELSETIQDVHSRNLSTQIDLPDVKDEVGSLTRSFNAMLARLDHAFMKQKKFSEQVAHELKTPLTTIKASTQVLLLDEEPTIEDYNMHTDAVAQSTDRLIHVVDGLLALAFEEHTTFADVCSGRHFYEKITRELAPIAAKSEVSFVIQEGDCELHCNEGLLYQAIYNVVENAVKYTEKGGTVTLGVAEQEDDVVFTIRDTGIGIDPDEVAYLFDAFYRGRAFQSSRVGSGLGLPLVKMIIEKHKGEIVVESEQGIGTIIAFTVRR